MCIIRRGGSVPAAAAAMTQTEKPRERPAPRTILVAGPTIVLTAHAALAHRAQHMSMAFVRMRRPHAKGDIQFCKKSV